MCWSVALKLKEFPWLVPENRSIRDKLYIIFCSYGSGLFVGNSERISLTQLKMKYTFLPFSPAILLCVGGMSGIWCSTAEARVGESRTTIEHRLMGSGGIVYRDDEIEEQRQRGMPYTPYLDYFPEDAQLRIYFKNRRRTEAQVITNGGEEDC